MANIRCGRQRRQFSEVITTTKKKQEKNDDDDDDDNKYKNALYSLPPYHRWFRYVLCPHYLAEILIYLSFAIILELAILINRNSTTTDNDNDNMTIEMETESICNLKIIYCIIISLGRRNRHWMLLLWVTTNLTVSALNSYDWYHYSTTNTTFICDNYYHKKDDSVKTNTNANADANYDSKNYQLLAAKRKLTTTSTAIMVHDKRTAIFPQIW